MYITWNGLSCIHLQTKDATLLIDPFAASAGLKAPRLTADAFLFTAGDNPQAKKAADNDGLVFATPGEFEVKGNFIKGTGVTNGKNGSLTVFAIHSEGINLAHLGLLAAPLENGDLEGLGAVDILFIPVGGGDVLDPKQAADLIAKIEPRIVIPIAYKTSDAFKKEMGIKGAEAVAKYRIAKKELPQDDVVTVFLQPQ